MSESRSTKIQTPKAVGGVWFALAIKAFAMVEATSLGLSCEAIRAFSSCKLAVLLSLSFFLLAFSLVVQASGADRSWTILGRREESTEVLSACKAVGPIVEGV